MKASSLANPRKGLYLYTALVEKVGLQHDLSQAGLSDLKNRVEQALVDGQLRSRDPESSLPVIAKGEETPLVSLDDFNEWLQDKGAGNLAIAEAQTGQGPTDAAQPDVAATGRPPEEGRTKRQTPTERQDDRLRIFRELGGRDPGDTGKGWRGTSDIAPRLGITRQSLTADLKIAYEREKDQRRSGRALGGRN
jgi:hypothetical protein